MTLSLQILILATFGWLVTVFSLHRGRRWLLFYITGGLGLILLVLFWTSFLGLNDALEALEARQVLAVARATGIALSLIGETGLAIPNHTGWAVFDIGIECSALLEMSAMIGLVVCYPVFGPARKAAAALIGTFLTYLLNLGRIMLIVMLINAFGSSWVFAAHAVFGRMLFFVGSVALYWWLITTTTVRYVGRQLEEPDA